MNDIHHNKNKNLDLARELSMADEGGQSAMLYENQELARRYRHHQEAYDSYWHAVHEKLYQQIIAQRRKHIAIQVMSVTAMLICASALYFMLKNFRSFSRKTIRLSYPFHSKTKFK